MVFIKNSFGSAATAVFVAAASILLMLCCCGGIGSAQAQSQSVWLENNPATTLYPGSLVKVKFSGYMSYAYCIIDLIDTETLESIQTYAAFGGAGFARFKLQSFPTIGNDITVQAKALLPSGSYGMQAVNSTHYNTASSPSKRSVSYISTSAGAQRSEQQQQEQRGYYSGVYAPEDAAVWIDGHPTVLGPYAHVAIFYEGIEDYNFILVQLVADDSSTLGIGGYGYEGYVHFIKFGLPDSLTAFVNVIVFDNDTQEPLFSFGSADSFGIICEPGLCNNKKKSSGAGAAASDYGVDQELGFRTMGLNRAQLKQIFAEYHDFHRDFDGYHPVVEMSRF